MIDSEGEDVTSSSSEEGQEEIKEEKSLDASGFVGIDNSQRLFGEKRMLE